MKIASKLLILFIIFGAIAIDEKVQAKINITVNGNWFLLVDASDLQAGAGSDLFDAYKSAMEKVRIDITETTGPYDRWRVDVKRSDSNWHPDFILLVRRTTDGNGPGGIGGGTTAIKVTEAWKGFFGGRGDRINIRARLILAGVSVQIPPDTYNTTVLYTVVDTY